MQQLMVAYNDLVDLNQEAEELLKSVEIVRGEYISHSKLFMNTARYVKLKKRFSKQNGNMDRKIESF